MEPELFAPAILSAGKAAFCSVFSPQMSEFFFATDIGENETADIAWMRRVKDQWTRPVAAPFSDGKHTDNDICISPDGNTVFFRSWRPLPGSDEPQERSVIWTADRTEDGWSAPRPVLCGGVPLRAGYPSVTKSGTLYFPYRHPSNIGESDIYLARLDGDTYGAPESLGATINTPYIEGDMCVAQDESFLVVSCWHRPDNRGESDLYISFRGNDGTWMKLMNMGEVINSPSNENCPMVSPDGKFFFYFRYDPQTDKSSTYWVDIRVMDRYRPKGLN
jgi:hypothetical protein